MSCSSIATESGRRVELKWHGLRRKAGEATMLRRNLEAGLAEGAVMEVDLQMTGDGRLVCLHDETLERETTGSGSIRERRSDELGGVRMRDASGAPTDEPLLFFEELVERVAAGATDGVELQLDLKVGAAALGDELVADFGRRLAGCAQWFSLSGAEAAGLLRLHAVRPEPQMTYSCSDALREGASEVELRERFGRALGELPGASMVWIQHRMLAAAYAAGFDVVAFAGERGVGVDTGTIDLDGAGDAEALAWALNVGVSG